MGWHPFTLTSLPDHVLLERYPLFWLSYSWAHWGRDVERLALRSPVAIAALAGLEAFQR